MRKRKKRQIAAEDCRAHGEAVLEESPMANPANQDPSARTACPDPDIEPVPEYPVPVPVPVPNSDPDSCAGVVVVVAVIGVESLAVFWLHIRKNITKQKSY